MSAQRFALTPEIRGDEEWLSIDGKQQNLINENTKQIKKLQAVLALAVR